MSLLVCVSKKGRYKGWCSGSLGGGLESVCCSEHLFSPLRPCCKWGCCTETAVVETAKMWAFTFWAQQQLLPKESLENRRDVGWRNEYLIINYTKTIMWGQWMLVMTLIFQASKYILLTFETDFKVHCVLLRHGQSSCKKIVWWSSQQL